MRSKGMKGGGRRRGVPNGKNMITFYIKEKGGGHLRKMYRRLKTR